MFVVAAAALAFPAQGQLPAPQEWAQMTGAAGVIEQMREVPVSVPAVPAPAAFYPARDDVLPGRRIVAFYGIPGAARSGPAHELSAEMLGRLRRQADEYRKLDSATPVLEGIDLVANVADRIAGGKGTYSHNLPSATVGEYVEFCAGHGLLLFLDLELGRDNIRNVLPSFLPILRRYPFVHLALDPEWAFPSGAGIPGRDYGSLPAADFNYAIDELAQIPGPRKILLIHQFRDSVLSSPEDKQAIDRRNPRVSVVLHVDSVGNFAAGAAAKRVQYAKWVGREWTELGGFKIFYDLERSFHPFTAAEVLKLNPAPLVVTYGN